jgi:ferric-dicitrate binding protein FerR (iron transport regulator)
MGGNDADWRQIQERLALIGDDDDDDDEESGVVATDDRDEESFASISKKVNTLTEASTAAVPTPPAKWTSTRHTPSQRRACMRISALVLCLVLVVGGILAAMWPKGHHAPGMPGKL